MSDTPRANEASAAEHDKAIVDEWNRKQRQRNAKTWLELLGVVACFVLLTVLPHPIGVILFFAILIFMIGYLVGVTRK